jgi:hypothetical protein
VVQLGVKSLNRLGGRNAKGFAVSALAHALQCDGCGHKKEDDTMTDYKTPADLGIEARQAMTQEQKFMYGLLDDFRAFVIDSMGDGLHEEFADHHAFLAAALETFEGIQNK